MTNTRNDHSAQTHRTLVTDEAADAPPPPRQPPIAERKLEATQPRVLFTVEEAAERLAISRAQMFVFLKQGAIQSVKVGRLRRIPADALDTYIARLIAEQRGA